MLKSNADGTCSGTFIKFVKFGMSPSGKTELWGVIGGEKLGRVCWYAPWRRYVFQPSMATVYEEVCLEEIAQFVRARTLDHKTRKRGAS